MKQFLECGKIVTTHGVAGEVKVQPWCDGPDFLSGFSRLFLGKGETALEVERCRSHKNMAIIKFRGVDDMDAALELRGRVLWIDRADAALSDGEYFVQDLIGLLAVDADSGREYGTVSDVSQTGANDVYHIRFPDGAERLIPAIPQVVIEIAPDRGEMRIRPLKGLFDDED